MVDYRRIVRQWRHGSAQVLVTLVRVEGSSYRRPGAHLLVGTDGEYAGTISGGCLEAEVVRMAAWIARKGAVVKRYSTLYDDTAEIPFGLGCGGIVDLLFEPVDTPECQALLAAIEGSLKGTEVVVMTYLPDAGTSLRRTIHVAEDADIAQGAISEMTEDGVYREVIPRPQRLFVLGGGEDAMPLVRMATMLGWNVTVADGRAQLVRPERFPEAERVVRVSSADELGLLERDAVVIMTHNYEQDRTLLAGVLGGVQPAYVGLLGARHRSSLLVAEVAAALGRGAAECCERVHAPVGLDLGGDGPEAIALAVMAEVQARLHGKPTGSRRLLAEEVAEQIEQGGSSRYLEARCTVGGVAGF